MKSYTTGIWELSGQNGKERKTGPYKASRPIKKNKNLTPQQISTNPLWSRQPPKKVNLQSGSQREAFCCGGQSHKKKKKGGGLMQGGGAMWSQYLLSVVRLGSNTIRSEADLVSGYIMWGCCVTFSLLALILFLTAFSHGLVLFVA